jgi:hypothetical protein
LNKSFDELSRRAIPFNPRLDRLIRVLANIALWGEAAREVPHHLQPSRNGPFWLTENRL